MEYIGVYTAAELAKKKKWCVREGVFLVSFIQHVEHPVTVRYILQFSFSSNVTNIAIRKSFL